MRPGITGSPAAGREVRESSLPTCQTPPIPGFQAVPREQSVFLGRCGKLRLNQDQKSGLPRPHFFPLSAPPFSYQLANKDEEGLPVIRQSWAQAKG